jgi:hypothetical protein
MATNKAKANDQRKVSAWDCSLQGLSAAYRQRYKENNGPMRADLVFLGRAHR